MHNFEGTILQASEKYPDTKSRTFTLLNRKHNQYFFMIKEKPDMMVGGKTVRSIIHCLVLREGTAELTEEFLPIKDEDEIENLTLQSFVAKVKQAIVRIKNNPDKYPSTFLNTYIKYGFTEENTTLD